MNEGLGELRVSQTLLFCIKSFLYRKRKNLPLFWYAKVLEKNLTHKLDENLKQVLHDRCSYDIVNTC